MYISIDQVRWGSYKNYSGAWFGGVQGVDMSEDLTWNQKTFLTVTRTEGGHLDAVNAYDRMIMTVGAIQFGEAGQYSVSDLLGAAYEAHPDFVMETLAEALRASKAEFKKNAKGRYRFFFKDSRGEVDRISEQQQLFLLNSDGMAWDNPSKAHVKLWVATMASVWASTETRKAQIEFTLPRLTGFMTKEARLILFGPDAPVENEGWAGALRSGYLSFAANLPAVASKHLLRVAATTKETPWSPEWCIEVLKGLTFGPQIAIYPGRYTKIRPVLEEQFGIDLPDMAEDLERWKSEHVTPTPPQVLSLGLGDFDELIEYQRELLELGYDLGPAGADGIMGRLTKSAIVSFQRNAGLTADGIVGMKTRKAFLNSALTRLGQSPLQ